MDNPEDMVILEDVYEDEEMDDADYTPPAKRKTGGTLGTNKHSKN